MKKDLSQCTYVNTSPQPLSHAKLNSQAISAPQTGRKHSPTTVQLNRGRGTCGHVINPLNDIIAENLGQRGRRAGELACRAVTTMAGLGRQQYGHPAYSSSCENGGILCGRNIQTRCMLYTAPGASSSCKETPRISLENLLKAHQDVAVTNSAISYRPIDLQFATPESQLLLPHAAHSSACIIHLLCLI